MKSSTAFSLHWWMTSHVFIQKTHYSLTSCQLHFLVPLSSFLAHLLALSHIYIYINRLIDAQTAHQLVISDFDLSIAKDQCLSQSLLSIPLPTYITVHQEASSFRTTSTTSCQDSNWSALRQP